LNDYRVFHVTNMSEPNPNSTDRLSHMSRSKF